MTINSKALCPCDSAKPYYQCCQPLHNGIIAATPELLMRSRYSAYVLGLSDYLMATWHPSTRPDNANAEKSLKWLGLTVKRAWHDSANQAFVEFVARYRIGGARAESLHEVSRFIREGALGQARWFYVDGVFKNE